ncbi:acyl carrier protein [Betaproteobacteria bacterium PRO7]|nr:acyl carrier protein [Betaproteobacteria bacterium PRO7]
MNRDELKQAIVQTLATIAPEIDAEALKADKPLRDQVDLDSADWLNFLVALHARTGVDIPDADAAKLTTLDRLVDYCGRKLGA